MKPHYHWFQGASVRELYDRLTAAGPDTAILKVTEQGNNLYLSVEAPGEVGAAEDNPPINDSHRCPPSCP